MTLATLKKVLKLFEWVSECLEQKKDNENSELEVLDMVLSMFQEFDINISELWEVATFLKGFRPILDSDTQYDYPIEQRYMHPLEVDQIGVMGIKFLKKKAVSGYIPGYVFEVIVQQLMCLDIEKNSESIGLPYVKVVYEIARLHYQLKDQFNALSFDEMTQILSHNFEFPENNPSYLVN